MYRLFQSDDLSTLVQEHRTLLSRELGEKATLLVVQSGPMQRWLSRVLAVRNGIWLAPDMATPDQALRSLLQNMSRNEPGIHRNAIYMDDLKLLCFQTLRDLISRSARERPLRDLYDRIGLPKNLPQGNPRLLRTVYGIADALAGLLYAYAQNFFADPRSHEKRVHLFDLWNEDDLVTRSLSGTSTAFQKLVMEHEIWQRDLYKLMFPDNRVYDILGYQTHRAVVENWKYEGSYKRIVLFGSAFLSAQAFAFFRSLAEEIEVVHCLFTPGRNLAVRQTGIGSAIDNETVAAWSELLSTFVNESAQLPISASFSANWLQESSTTTARGTGKAKTAFAGVISGTPKNALQTLQFIVSGGNDPAATASSMPSKQFEFDLSAGTTLLDASSSRDAVDHSLRFVDCTTRLREVESLKQRILRLMTERNKEQSAGQTAETQPLLLTDIAIMAPDIRIYRPYIETVFNSFDHDGKPRPDHLPYNIVDLSFGEGSAVVSALDVIIELDTSRLERSSLFALLDNAAVCEAANIDQGDVELFRRWADAMEARWGLNAQHRDELQTGYNWQNTWDRAFARFIEGGLTGSIPAARVDTGRISQIMLWVHDTFNDVRDMAASTLGIEAWTSRFRNFLDRCLAPADEAETATMERIRGILANLNTSHKNLTGEQNVNPALLAPIDWFGFKTLFRDQLSHLSASRGQHQVDGIVCSSIRPYRAIPFKLIAVLGMNEGEFPRPDEAVSFDLSGLPGQNIARVNNQVQDSYAWLETISSAREYLWVFYQGRDPASGESLSPSSLVDDSCDLIRHNSAIDPDSLRSRERVSVFDTGYFEAEVPGSDLWNLSEHDLAISRSLQKAGSGATIAQESVHGEKPAVPGEAFGAPLGGAQGEILSLRFSDLRDFLVYPLKSAFNHRLGIWIDKNQDPKLADREPLDPGSSQFTAASERALAAFWENDAAPARDIEFGESWFAADELVDGPGSALVVESLGAFLNGTLGELGEKLRGLTPENTTASEWKQAPPIAIDLQLAGVGLADPSIAGHAGEEAARDEFSVRIEAELNDYYLHESGIGLILLRGRAPVTTGSGFKASQIAHMALVKSLAEYANLPQPKFAMVLPTRPGRTGAGKDMLKVFELSPDPAIPLRAMVEGYVRNLASPFPLYGNCIQSTTAALVKTDSLEDTARALPVLEEAWHESWRNLDEPNAFATEWPPINPLDCPYFTHAWPQDTPRPPWKNWYGPAFLSIWEPLIRFRESFKSRSTLYGKGKKKA